MKLFRRVLPETDSFDVAGITVQIKRMPQARRMRLTVDPRDGIVRLVLPKRASLRAAKDWALEKADWISAQVAAVPQAEPILPGSRIPFNGGTLVVELSEDRSRGVRQENNRLLVAGPPEMVGHRVLRWLRREAQELLESETHFYARQAGVSIGKVGLGDPRGRWGSCSSNGDIRYSWRLILSPPEVRRATVAHEVAHRLHMNHSAAFHDAVRTLYGREPAAERHWLRVHGASLHRIGRR